MTASQTLGWPSLQVEKQSLMSMLARVRHRFQSLLPRTRAFSTIPRQKDVQKPTAHSGEGMQDLIDILDKVPVSPIIPGINHGDQSVYLSCPLSNLFIFIFSRMELFQGKSRMLLLTLIVSTNLISSEPGHKSCRPHLPSAYLPTKTYKKTQCRSPLIHLSLP